MKISACDRWLAFVRLQGMIVRSHSCSHIVLRREHNPAKALTTATADPDPRDSFHNMRLTYFCSAHEYKIGYTGTPAYTVATIITRTRTWFFLKTVNYL